jgi:hypothetical protein
MVSLIRKEEIEDGKNTGIYTWDRKNNNIKAD